MTSSFKWWELALAVCVASCAVLIPAAFMAPKLMHPAPAYTCAAPGPDELCPSPAWWAKYTEYTALAAKYAPPHDVQLKLRGMLSDLRVGAPGENEGMPAGYDVDAAKRRWVKVKGPATPTPAATPTPTPEPAK
jgi:hypothetical protein